MNNNSKQSETIEAQQVAVEVEQPSQPESFFPVWARLLMFFGAYLFVTGIITGIAMLVFGIPIDQPVDDTRSLLIVAISNLMAVMLIVWIFRRFLDRRTVFSLGFSWKGRWRDFLWGLLLAILLFGIGSLILVTTGNISFVPGSFSVSVLLSQFVLFICVSLSEEIMCRGYFLNNLMGSMNKYWALILTSAIFALMHALNPNLSVLGMLNLFLAGILLGATYIFIRNLWFPISLHLFWNFIQGPVLGYEVSGQTTDSMFSINYSGPDFLTGGTFGFEASILCTVLPLLATFLIIWYYRKCEGKSLCIEK